MHSGNLEIFTREEAEKQPSENKKKIKPLENHEYDELIKMNRYERRQWMKKNKQFKKRKPIGYEAGPQGS